MLKEHKKPLLFIFLLAIISFGFIGLGSYALPVPETSKVEPPPNAPTIPEPQFITVKAWWEITTIYQDGSIETWKEGETTFQLMQIFKGGKPLSSIKYQIKVQPPSEGTYFAKAVIGATLLDLQTGEVYTIIPKTENNNLQGIIDFAQIQTAIPQAYRHEGGQGDFMVILSAWLEVFGEGKKGSVNMAEVKIPITYKYIAPNQETITPNTPSTEGSSQPSDETIISTEQGDTVELTFVDYNGNTFKVIAYKEPWDGYTIKAIDINGYYLSLIHI